MKRCNHCILEDCKKYAASRGYVLTTRVSKSPSFPHGHDVFISKPGDEDPRLDWVVWLASIPDKCAC